MDVLKLIGRTSPLFIDDIVAHESQLRQEIERSTFLVIGGAGSIGQAVVKELFNRNPKSLCVVDISENNLAELVRELRSSKGYIVGDFKTFAIDCGSLEFERFFSGEGPFDYVFNLSALKHVRSEKDPYTLMRMIEVNVLNTIKTIEMAKAGKAKKYFCVSTDKAANPANMMGASKRIMEMFLVRHGDGIDISTARFANVAFSDGSLLCSFNNRIQKRQPIVAPHDVKRYFVTPAESGELCLLSGILGNNRDIFFPKLDAGLHELAFSEIAIAYLAELGYGIDECSTEEEAREKCRQQKKTKNWPCLFTGSDTTGEKKFEEFYVEGEVVDLDRFGNVGVVENAPAFDEQTLDFFLESIHSMRVSAHWDRESILSLFKEVLPHFSHIEKGKSLDSKM